MRYALKRETNVLPFFICRQESKRKERDMNNQEKPVSQLAQESNEDFAILGEELLDAVTGVGGCMSCAKAPKAMSAPDPRAAPHDAPPNLIKNEHGQVATLAETTALWLEHHPDMPGWSYIWRSQPPLNWIPNQVVLSDGQTGYVRSRSLNWSKLKG